MQKFVNADAQCAGVDIGVRR